MRLSAIDLNFLHRFGYLHVPGFFAPAETARIIAGFERTLAEFGHPTTSAPGAARAGILGPIQHLPEMHALLDDPRVVGVCESVLGEGFTYACGDGRLYAGDTQWHPDGSWGDLFACKLAFYLDPLTRATGALRVVPGSHLPNHPLRTAAVDPTTLRAEFGIGGADLPGAEALETQPGDLVLFNHDTFHASFGGNGRRRMFTMNVLKRAETDADWERVRRYIGTHSPSGYKFDIGAHHFRPILDTASPARMRHLEQAEEAHRQVFPQHTAPKTHAEQIEAMRRALSPPAAAAA